MTSTNALVTQILSFLQSEYAAQVAAAGLPPFTGFLDYLPGLPQVTKAPEVWVDVTGMDRTGLAEFGGPNAKQARNRTVVVYVTAAGPDESTVHQQLRAYADLLVALMEGNQGQSGQALRTMFERTRFSEPMQSGAGLFRLASVTFSMPRWAALGAD